MIERLFFQTNLHYKNSPIHRIVPDFVLQMGDITVGDGTGGKCFFLLCLKGKCTIMMI